MKTTQPNIKTEASAEPLKKQGFLSKVVSKLDTSMKQKADDKAKQSQCCGTNSKGGKCC